MIKTILPLIRYATRCDALKPGAVQIPLRQKINQCASRINTFKRRYQTLMLECIKSSDAFKLCYTELSGTFNQFLTKTDCDRLEQQDHNRPIKVTRLYKFEAIQVM